MRNDLAAEQQLAIIVRTRALLLEHRATSDAAGVADKIEVLSAPQAPPASELKSLEEE